MNAPSVDIKDYLETQSSLGLVFGSDLFIGKEPTAPRNVVTIFDTPGYPGALTIDGKTYYYPTIQIRVRNENYLGGWTIIENIKSLLHGLASQTINGTLYTVIYCSSGPALLDWDENNNVRFIINFNLQRR